MQTLTRIDPHTVVSLLRSSASRLGCSPRDIEGRLRPGDGKTAAARAQTAKAVETLNLNRQRAIASGLITPKDGSAIRVIAAPPTPAAKAGTPSQEALTAYNARERKLQLAEAEMGCGR